MVMMEKPSPIQVGREFVRQYYTLLNKAPSLLHRFYSYNSSYVHGGKYCDGEPEKPIIGQTEIHQKIDSLNFRDCHTKIRQVDAHSTIGNGVVVQVTGELSNSGQPLRRFMQTFVLAPQGDNPFKFYVHNDIFRYQDEVFNDDITMEHSDEEQDAEEEITEQVNDANEENYYQPPPPVDNNQQQNGLANGIIDQSIDETAMDQHNDTPSPVPEDHIEQISPAPTPPPETENINEVVEEEESVEAPKESEAVREVEPVEPKAPSKPLSWADLASKNTNVVRNTTQQPVSKPVVRPPPEQQPEQSEGNDISRPPRPQRTNNLRAPVREEDRGGQERLDSNRRFGPNNLGVNTSIRYPDNQQIFVGNLPYEISEDDLREHFAEYGRVIEVRINQSHSNNPNFGFVIFEDPKSVDSVLDAMPTYHKSGHRINIEEKKQRNNRDGNRRPGDMRRMGGMGDVGRGGRRMPQSMRRDRQGSREGPRPPYSNGPRR